MTAAPVPHPPGVNRDQVGAGDASRGCDTTQRAVRLVDIGFWQSRCSSGRNWTWILLMLSSVVTRSSPSSATQEISSVRSDLVARVLWGLPENIAADIGLVGCWRSLSGPCNRPLRTSTCIVTRQPSAQITQITLRPTSAPLADIRSLSARCHQPAMVRCQLGVENRACICTGPVQAARVLTHY